ncbi:MAG TPA: sigma-70 family RNA polymerase sigma factor [Ktedonobacterales bacterium]
MTNYLAAAGALDGVALSGVGGVATGDALAASEAALIQRARAGDQDAFAMLVRLHQRQVYTLALRMLRDPEEASEATQDVFLAAWQGLGRFREEARFATWLYRITYRHCLKVSEGRRRDEAARAQMAAEHAIEQGSHGALVNAQARAAEAEVRETVRAEIALLPPKYRYALVLRHLQEMSYEEIAEVMRMPIGTVKTHLFRARALLKERLSDLERARAEGLARAEDLRVSLQTTIDSIEAGLRGLFERGHEAPGVSGEEERP